MPAADTITIAKTIRPSPQASEGCRLTWNCGIAVLTVKVSAAQEDPQNHKSVRTLGHGRAHSSGREGEAISNHP